MGKDTYNGPLEQVDACCWRIPKSYKQGMRVDGLIFTNERLLEQLKKDQAPDQVANVAFLPGIQYASLAMPDIHWGYGFCIGGVCATDPQEGGVISPGGVGYDINCLSYDALIIHEHGYTRKIGEMAEEWQRARLTCYDLGRARRTTTGVQRWFGQKPRAEVLRLRTEAGDEVRATADHPFWTPDGMVPLGKLRPGDRVAVAPFQGVPYEKPSDEVIVSEADVVARLTSLGKGDNGSAAIQVLNYLKARDLLPLRYSSPQLPYLCKILGFVLGDGNLHFVSRTGKGNVHFYGNAADLEDIRTDLLVIGMKPSRIYSRQRQHTIQTVYDEYSFERREEWCKVVSSGFTVLLACLGAPVGKKTHQSYPAPAWLDAAPLWQKRLFLAAFFGAELTTPATITGHGTVFGAPTIGMNKRPEHVESGRLFLQQLASWLEDFGVAAQSILHEEKVYQNTDGKHSDRLRLVLSPVSESLLNLWGRIGFEYNRKRCGLAALAVQYLKHKERILGVREQAAQTARVLVAQGVTPKDVYARLTGPNVNRRFLERSLYESRKTPPRIGSMFPTFKAYCTEAADGLPYDGMVWERIASIKPATDYTGDVFDFTVSHPDHNFVANGFVVSNCGVRLVRSNLFYRDVKPHLRTLVEDLFRNVPTGVGRSGRYKFDKKELSHLLGEGPRYLTGRGLATRSDIEHTEAEGRLDGADPSMVSDHALNRGAEQCGTLGSGNHFLEVQVVDHVFDEEAAQVMGLEKDMVCVMIHSGSRGLGYQVCDDALAMLRKVPEKYGIELPDRQLACAPIDCKEGKHYIAAMRAAANFAWCNRQLLMQQAREVFAAVFGRSWQELHMNLVYDVCHNIAKFEEHTVGGKRKKVWVHRKGATRAFPPDHPEIPALYRKIGQPVIIPGDMGRASWVLVGQPGSMERTFGTTCHGAGRAISRKAAVKDAAGRRIDKELEARGVIARAQSRAGLAEEQPKAYKNVDDVVEVVHDAGLSRKVARMRPIGVIKG
jgi:tRNA-splicing ligase RtcB